MRSKVSPAKSGSPSGTDFPLTLSKSSQVMKLSARNSVCSLGPTMAIDPSLPSMQDYRIFSYTMDVVSERISLTKGIVEGSPAP